MTKVMLMNFGDSLRIIPDAQQQMHSIAPGQAKELELSESTCRFIERAAKQFADPLLIVQSQTKVPEIITLIMGILRQIDTQPYDELLSSVQSLIGADEYALRPSRGALRIKLREIAQRYALDASITKYDVEKLAKEIRPKPPEPKQIEIEEKPKLLPHGHEKKREIMDDVLGIVTGDEIGLEGDEEAANPEDGPEIEPKRARKAVRGRQGTRKKGPTVSSPSKKPNGHQRRSPDAPAKKAKSARVRV